jgi:hypothetical protein
MEWEGGREEERERGGEGGGGDERQREIGDMMVQREGQGWFNVKYPIIYAGRKSREYECAQGDITARAQKDTSL